MTSGRIIPGLLPIARSARFNAEMTDIVDAKTRSRMMAGIRGKDTRPELLIRRAIFRLFAPPPSNGMNGFSSKSL